jgi:integrase
MRWQPVTLTLMRALIAHAEDRGAAVPDSPLLRYANGRPITYRRYDHIWDRVRRHLPWADSQQISTHWLRHTTLTWVERNFGYAIAHAFAGHTDSHDNATSTYIKADIADIATALAAMTGEPHPLANRR